MKLDPSFFVLVFGLALVGACGLAGHELGRANKLQNQVRRNEACVKGVAAGDGGQVSLDCDPAVTDIFLAASRAERCDIALGNGGTAPECSANVASLAASEASLKLELQTTVADRDAAISRAAARTQVQVKRKEADEEALKLAPHDRDGLVVCDAGCLRARFEPAGS